mgnify:CR=1 FL=1
MVPTKKSDRLIGFLGILQALLLIWFAQMVIDDAIELQDDMTTVKNNFQDEMGCSESSDDQDCADVVTDLNGWIDGVKSDIVIWQALYAFAGIVSVVFLLISVRLMTGTELLLNSLFTNQNRSLFFYTSIFITVLGYFLGMFEASMMNSMIDGMWALFESWDLDPGPVPPKAGAMEYNGGAWAFVSGIFLVINGLIGLLTRGPINGAETAVPAEVKELSGATELDDLLPPE